MYLELGLFEINSINFLNFDIWKFLVGVLLFFIIIYLVRPKPKEKIIPSLMFLISKRKKGKFNSFLRRLMRDPLFFIQILLLILFCFIVLEPIASYDYDITSENTILVLDVSASMHAGDRFETMKKLAKENMRGSISTILIKNQAQIYFQNLTIDDAKDQIDMLQLSFTTSNILDSIRKANEMLGNQSGKIIVISDFNPSVGNIDDIIQYKTFLENKERFIEYIQLPKLNKNIGFISAEMINNRISLSLKNFNSYDEIVKIKIEDEVTEMEIKADSIEILRLNAEKGLSRVTIENKDDFDIDNHFYLNVPSNKKMKILLITNKEESYIKDFLTSSPYIELDVEIPPIVPKIEHDVVVISEIDTDRMLSKISDDLKKYVEQGGALAILTQKKINELKLEELMPVKIKDEIVSESDVKIMMHEITRDINFPITHNFYKSELKEGSIMLVTAQESPIVALKKYGNGEVLYYGIPEEKNEFKLDAGYPLFWNRALNFISNFNDYDHLNRKTNEIGYEDKIGFVDEPNKKIAVNLLNEIESDITKEIKFNDHENNQITETKNNLIIQNFDLLLILIPILIILIIFEIFFIKYRGDI